MSTGAVNVTGPHPSEYCAVVVTPRIAWGRVYMQTRMRTAEYNRKTRVIDLTIASSLGAAHYQWVDAGSQEALDFLLGCNPVYLMEKLLGEDAKEDDREGFIHNIREHICMLRWESDLTRKEARDAWDDLNFLVRNQSPIDEIVSLMGSHIDAVYELIPKKASTLAVSMFEQIIDPWLNHMMKRADQHWAGTS